jgi:hypothetical protein
VLIGSDGSKGGIGGMFCGGINCILGAGIAILPGIGGSTPTAPNARGASLVLRGCFVLRNEEPERPVPSCESLVASSLYVRFFATGMELSCVLLDGLLGGGRWEGTGAVEGLKTGAVLRRVEGGT